MNNPFDEINQKLDTIILLGEKILTILASPTRKKIPFSDFCKEHGITRPTAYAWRDRGLIRIEKIGGKNFVLSDSIAVDRKYKRKPLE